ELSMLVPAFRAQSTVRMVRAQYAVQDVFEIGRLELSPELASIAGIPQRHRARSGVVVVGDHGAASTGCGPEDEGPGLVARCEGADGTQTPVSATQFVRAVRVPIAARADGAHWSTFALRAPVFALGAARRAHGFSAAGARRHKRRGDQPSSERYCFARRAHHAAISPTTPRRNASTQTTNITPVITVTHCP